jgi:hypothetical protein
MRPALLLSAPGAVHGGEKSGGIGRFRVKCNAARSAPLFRETHRRNPWTCEANGSSRPPTGSSSGAATVGQSLYLFFEDFGDQTGRFEIFWTLNEAAAFLRECGLEIPALDA